MKDILLDSNVLLDLFTRDPVWYSWSCEQIECFSASHRLGINPIIYAEIAYRFERIEELEEVLRSAGIARFSLPWEAAFLAAKCHMAYRQRGGKRQATLPDFFIGAHASIAGMPLLTRDVVRYRQNFPRLELICPE